MFKPELVIFEEEALFYPLGMSLYRLFREQGVPTGFTGSHNRVTGIPGKTRSEKFAHAKRTLVVGIRRNRGFETCRPSANYQLPLVTGCPGFCEYCYLLTNLGRNPYVRIYVNLDEILQTAASYISKHLPETTVFEGAATSDPLAVENYTGALARSIEFFAGQPGGRFRFVTKFTEVDSLLSLQHKGATRIRFSINSRTAIKMYEHGTPCLEERLQAAQKTRNAGYPLGFMIAPIIAEGRWEEEYSALLDDLAPFCDTPDLTFELITHRFTARAKEAIKELFPYTKLPLGEEERAFKWGQFGYGKYVYRQDLLKKIEEFFRENLKAKFPDSRIEYFV